MNSYEFFSLIFAFMTFIFAFIAITQGRKNFKLQSEIAQLQGVYNNPQLDIQIFNKSLVKECFIAFPFKKNGIFVVPLKISLTNKGKSRANNIELYFSASNEILPPDIMVFEIKVNTFSKTDSQKIKITENKTTYGVKMEYLDQDCHGDVILHIPLRDSTVNIKHRADFKTKDNRSINVGFRFSFSYILKIWVHSENHSPLYKELAISAIDTSEISIRDFFVNQCIESEKHHKSRLKDLNNIQKMEYYLNPNHELKPTINNICYITSDDFQESQTDKKVFHPNKIEIGFGVISSDGFALIGPLNMSGYPKNNFK